MDHAAPAPKNILTLCAKTNTLLARVIMPAKTRTATPQTPANPAAVRRGGQSATPWGEPRLHGIWPWEMDVASGETHVDPRLAEHLDIAPEDAPRSFAEWLDCILPDDRVRIQAQVEALLAGTSSSFDDEFRLLHAQGNMSWVIGRGVRQRTPDGSARISGLLIDITRRKQAEIKSEAERKRLFSLLDRLPAYVALIASDHSLRFVNHAYRERFGDPTDKSCHTVVCDRSEPCEICPTFDVFETKTLHVWERELPDREQVLQVFDYPFYEADGTPLVLQCSIDITRVYKTQAALAASEQRYRSITDNLSLGIAVLNRDLRIMADNPKMVEWFGASEDKCLARCRFTTSELLPDTCPCKKTFADGGVHESLLAIPNSNRTFRVTACPIFSSQGQVDSVIEIVDDVTQKLLVEERLEHGRKLQALGTLAGGIAHEINQPLNALQLYVSGLEMVLEKNETIDRDMLMTRLAWILNETEHIQAIIEHMRALVRQDDLSLSSVDVNDVVRKSLTLVGAQLSAHGIGLALNLAAALPGTRANAVQLEQVVLNLTVNAMHALDETSSNDKRLHITTATIDVNGVPGVAISVSDNGPGFKGKESRIFDPFFTTKPAGQGMGLGLSIVHSFVTSWGGDITARSNPAGGATFTVQLPAAAMGQE